MTGATKIGYDFDSTIINNYDLMIQYFLDKYDWSPPQPPRQFFIEFPDHISHKEIQEALFYMHDHMPPLRQSTYWLRRLHGEGGPFVHQPNPIIITCRNEGLRSKMITWMQKWYRCKFELFFVKRHRDKAKLIEGLGINIFVEDRFRSCVEIASISSVKRVYMIDLPHNQGRKLVNKIHPIWNLEDVFNRESRIMEVTNEKV